VAWREALRSSIILISVWSARSLWFTPHLKERQNPQPPSPL
jgi:hypothetical protein